jgi:hypothetical protein
MHNNNNNKDNHRPAASASSHPAEPPPTQFKPSQPQQQQQHQQQQQLAINQTYPPKSKLSSDSDHNSNKNDKNIHDDSLNEFDDSDQLLAAAALAAAKTAADAHKYHKPKFKLVKSSTSASQLTTTVATTAAKSITAVDPYQLVASSLLDTTAGNSNSNNKIEFYNFEENVPGANQNNHNHHQHHNDETAHDADQDGRKNGHDEESGDEDAANGEYVQQQPEPTITKASSLNKDTDGNSLDQYTGQHDENETGHDEDEEIENEEVVVGSGGGQKSLLYSKVIDNQVQVSHERSSSLVHEEASAGKSSGALSQFANPGFPKSITLLWTLLFGLVLLIVSILVL